MLTLELVRISFGKIELLYFQPPVAQLLVRLLKQNEFAFRPLLACDAVPRVPSCYNIHRFGSGNVLSI